MPQTSPRPPSRKPPMVRRSTHSRSRPRPHREPLLPGRVFLVPLGDLRGLLITAVDEDAPAKGRRAARRNREVAHLGVVLVVLEIVLTKRIRGEQRVRAHVPPCRVPRVFRMV